MRIRTVAPTLSRGHWGPRAGGDMDPTNPVIPLSGWRSRPAALLARGHGVFSRPSVTPNRLQHDTYRRRRGARALRGELQGDDRSRVVRGQVDHRWSAVQ